MDKSNPCNCCNRCKAAKALLISVGDRVEAKATSGRWWPARVTRVRGLDELGFDLIVDDGCSTKWTSMPKSSIRRRGIGERRKKGSIPREAALLVPGESRTGTDVTRFDGSDNDDDEAATGDKVEEEATKNGGKKRKRVHGWSSDCTRGNPCGVYYRCPKHTLFGRPKRP